MNVCRTGSFGRLVFTIFIALLGNVLYVEAQFGKYTNPLSIKNDQKEDPLQVAESREIRQLPGIHYRDLPPFLLNSPKRPLGPPRPQSRHRPSFRPQFRYRPIKPGPSGKPFPFKHGKERVPHLKKGGRGGGGGGGYGKPHSGGHKHHEVVEVHKGGYGHDEHKGGGGYGHEEHKGGYGHDPHAGYGTVEHHGYKEPPKKIKSAPYYGPKYTPYDLIAMGKAKKSKKTKFGDDPVHESKTGGYGPTKYDKPISHFGGFGGGGSVKYHKGGYGHQDSGYGHSEPQGYGHSSGGHKKQGYEHSPPHKSVSGNYGKAHIQHEVVKHEFIDNHKGYDDGGSHIVHEEIKIDDYPKEIHNEKPTVIHLEDPHNTYDPHASATTNPFSYKNPLPISKQTADVDVEHMLLSDPYKLKLSERRSDSDDSEPATVVKMEPANKS